MALAAASCGSSGANSPGVCRSAAEMPDGRWSVEQQGVGEGATLWAQFFLKPAQVPTVGEELKVVWRMTGSGDLAISATGPTGTVLQPIWGPNRHGGSTWDRPGDEWGTGWIFPAPGCWTINAKRDSGSGYLAVRIQG